MNEREDATARRKKFKTIMKTMRQNPERGLRDFYEAYKKIMQVTAEVICRSVDKANQVVNDVLLKIWRSAKTIKEMDNPEGWIYRITANTAKDTFREREELSLNENITSNESEIQRIVDEDAFYWYIQDLSPEEQEILTRRMIARDTFQEIADETGKPLSTITSLYYRSLQKIKEKIEKIS